jgi:hypothetical protein
VDERVDHSRLQHSLDLTAIACSDVRQRPADLSLDALLCVGVQHHLECWQTPRGDGKLRLDLVTGHDVADHAEGRSLHRASLMVQKADSNGTDASFENLVDLALIVSVGDVRQGPARVCDHVCVWRLKKASENRECRKDVLKWRCGLATAQVGDGPDHVAAESGSYALSSFQ